MNFHTTLITAAILLIAAIFLSIIVSFAGMFGLDFSTALEVCIKLFFVTAAAFAASKLTKMFNIIPTTLALYFLSFKSAFHYWAYGPEGTLMYNYKISGSTPWYANEWVQVGIVIFILVIGHFLAWKMRDES